jgi:hypothetical protein
MSTETILVSDAEPYMLCLSTAADKPGNFSPTSDPEDCDSHGQPHEVLIAQAVTARLKNLEQDGGKKKKKKKKKKKNKVKTGMARSLRYLIRSLTDVPPDEPSGPPSPPDDSGTTTPRVSIMPCPPRLKAYYPPPNYGTVEEDKIFRSSFPQERHMDFVKSLGVRSVLYVPAVLHLFKPLTNSC